MSESKKLWYIYTIEFYAAERKKELLPFVTAWMELESIMLSEISQVVRDRYHMILHHCFQIIYNSRGTPPHKVGMAVTATFLISKHSGNLYITSTHTYT